MGPAGVLSELGQMSFNCDRKSVITLPAAVAQRSALRCTGWKVVGSNPIRMINYQIFRALIGYYVEMGVLKVSGKARITQPSFVYLTDVLEGFALVT